MLGGYLIKQGKDGPAGSPDSSSQAIATTAGLLPNGQLFAVGSNLLTLGDGTQIVIPAQDLQTLCVIDINSGEDFVVAFPFVLENQGFFDQSSLDEYFSATYSGAVFDAATGKYKRLRPAGELDELPIIAGSCAANPIERCCVAGPTLLQGDANATNLDAQFGNVVPSVAIDDGATLKVEQVIQAVTVGLEYTATPPFPNTTAGQSPAAVNTNFSAERTLEVTKVIQTEAPGNDTDCTSRHVTARLAVASINAPESQFVLEDLAPSLTVITDKVTGHGTIESPYAGIPDNSIVGTVAIFGLPKDFVGLKIRTLGSAVGDGYGIVGSNSLAEPVQVRSVDCGVTNTYTFIRNTARIGWDAARTDCGERPVKKLLIVAQGESNTGGIALNANLHPEEIGPRNLNFLNVTTLLFEPLHIGVNNNLDHLGLDSTTHSWENGLATINEGDSTRDIWYVQAGQGGSKVLEWVGGFGGGIPKRDERLAAAKSVEDFDDVVFWISIGINDARDATPLADYRDALPVIFANIRAACPGAKIVITELIDDGTTNDYNLLRREYDAEIRAAADADADVISVSVEGLPLLNFSHWNAEGHRLLARRMYAATKILTAV